MQKLCLWVARGFNIGLIPFAPGTFGSLLGLGWFFILAAPRNLWIFLAGLAATAGLSVWTSEIAEKALGRADPSEVVIDEIAAMPLCFLGWFLWLAAAGEIPSVAFFLQGRALWVTVGIYLAFRLFDIWKPWPVGAAQRLPGGWGVTIDDLLAAGYVNLLVLAALATGLAPLK